MKTPLLSVIIPTYNNPDLLKETLGFLEEQDFPVTEFEVVVVNDGSQDGTARLIDQYTGRLNLRGVHLTHNSGRSTARNRGVDKSSGEVLVFLDSDMEFDSDFLSRHFSYHEQGDKLVVIGSVQYKSSLGKRAYTRFLQSRGVGKFTPDTEIAGRYFLSGNASMTRDVFDRTGGFDPEIKYGEDIDFGIQLEQIGCKIITGNKLAVFHNHVRSLEEAAEGAFRFGRYELPKLVQKHPSLEQVFHLDYPGNLFEHLFAAIFLNPLLYRFIKGFIQLFNDFWVPGVFYQYFLYYNYKDGYKNSSK